MFVSQWRITEKQNQIREQAEMSQLLFPKVGLVSDVVHNVYDVVPRVSTMNRYNQPKIFNPGMEPGPLNQAWFTEFQ